MQRAYQQTWLRAFALVGLATVTGGATCVQNSFVTIKRSGATTTQRVVAYGDSIYAGFDTDEVEWGLVARRADPYVLGEYLGRTNNSNVQVVRLTEAGATAAQILSDEVQANASYMNAETVVVMLDSCGNDYLQARTALNGQSGTCNFGVLTTAIANCLSNTTSSMAAIASNQYGAQAKRLVATLYYPGYNADAGTLGCTDPSTGQPGNRQNIFLSNLANSNYQICQIGRSYGFQCVDLFSEFMGADYDSSGNNPGGVADKTLLSVNYATNQANYVSNVTTTYRSLVTDALNHRWNASNTYDYILTDDDTHPTYYGGTMSFTTSAPSSGGSYKPDFSGTNTVWYQYGHEKGGWAGASLLGLEAP